MRRASAINTLTMESMDDSQNSQLALPITTGVPTVDVNNCVQLHLSSVATM